MIKRYDKFIESRKYRILPEGTYTENHHILPESWGGTRDEENMIRLTAREHYIAHKMLFRENRNDKSMAHAFWRMCSKSSNSKNHSREYKVTSRDYEMGKIAHSNHMREILTGVPKSEESIRKNSESHKGRIAWNKGKKGVQTAWNKGKTGEQSHRYGRKATVETKAKQSASNSCYVYRCVETGDLIHNKSELQEFTNNPKAATCTVAKRVRTGNSYAYGYHWEIIIKDNQQPS